MPAEKKKVSKTLCPGTTSKTFEKHTRGLGTTLYIPESKFVQIYGKQIYANLHALKNQCSSEPLVQGHICSKLAVVGGRILPRSSKSSVYIQL